jgi:hypothetical protein
VNPATAGVLSEVLGKALGREPSKGTMLALAILFFWLAGVLFFVAFQGSGILEENAPVGGQGGASYFKAIISGLTAKAATVARGGQ